MFEFILSDYGFYSQMIEQKEEFAPEYGDLIWYLEKKVFCPMCDLYQENNTNCQRNDYI